MPGAAVADDPALSSSLRCSESNRHKHHQQVQGRRENRAISVRRTGPKLKPS